MTSYIGVIRGGSVAENESAPASACDANRDLARPTKEVRRAQQYARHTHTRGGAGVTNTADKFWARTVPSGACVEWTGSKDHYGYGQLSWQNRQTKAHRLAFFLRLGRWPDGILRHLCNNKACVLHVVEGTHAENMMDAVAAGTQNMVRKTHCANGHPYVEGNIYRDPKGRRVCRTCQRETGRRRRERLRQQGMAA